MQSIQVSKGSSSVKNGYEAITGQINVEFKKPQLPEADWFSANLFASSTNRYEANADATVKLSKRWSTSLLAHYENETKAHDSNDDGFADIPRVEQYNLWNRWAYMGDRYVFQAGIKVLTEDRNSGQVSHGKTSLADPYKISIGTDRYEAFTNPRCARKSTLEELTRNCWILLSTITPSSFSGNTGSLTIDSNMSSVWGRYLFRE